jgi:pimeloyl-ACP methyl ester carboxylesterase
MTLDSRIRRAEERLFESSGLDATAAFVELGRTGVRLRVLSFGSGRPLLLLHGVTLSAAAWTPLIGELTGFRLHAVELPGHGLSGPVDYRRGAVRDHTVRLLDDLFDALELAPGPVVGHSLGAMFALWYAAARPGRIGSLAVLADPAVALPGVTVRMPLSLMTVPVLAPAVLRSPSPRGAYRRLFDMGMGGGTAGVPGELIDVLRFAARRPGNARTVAALMHAINGFRHPRPESVMGADELGRVSSPTLFLWGLDDPYLAPRQARPWIDKMPTARLHTVPGGHGFWLEDPAGCAEAIAHHFAATGFPPAEGGVGPGTAVPA